MMRWIIPVLLLPGAALAEDWKGIWSADPDWCVNASQIGSVTPAPISLTDTEFLGYENSCDIIVADEIADMNAWVIEMECQSEGDVYDEKRLVMVSGKTLFMWFGADDPIRFERCAQ